tara:strand:- start:2469 stop:2756 length:288 start_codon:yes stop_codon:yes gene_type:complete
VLYLIITNVCLAFLLMVSLYYNYRHGVLLLTLQDAIESSLDELDERYKTMSAVVEKPIFFDSVEVRQVIKDINLCRNSILNVARNMTVIDQSVEK